MAVAQVGEPAAAPVIDLQLTALPPGARDIGEVAPSLDGRGECDDVVGAGCPEQREPPLQPPPSDVGDAPQSAFERGRRDLAQRRVGDESAFEQAGPDRVAATELERRRRAVGLRIAGEQGEGAHWAPGQAGGGIKAPVDMTSVDGRVVP